MHFGRFLATALFALALPACNDSCDELEEQCANCPGNDDASEITELACRAVVDNDDEDICDEALDSPGFECP
jgi:hypothetical protein